MQELYRFEKVSKILSGREVLRDINLSINEGECVQLIGTNGSGKSMLLRMLAGILHPDRGTIYYKNKILGKDIRYIEDQGVIIETPAFWPDLSGRENLILLAEINKKISEPEIDRWLDFYELGRAADLVTRKYSLGMRQKLGLIQAFMEEPKLLLLDEPLNSLDTHSVDKTRTYLEDFVRQGGTLVMSSHHRDDFPNFPGRVLQMEEGGIV